MAGNGPLLASQRRAFILAEVSQRGGVRVADLIATLNVSDVTIRRDLDALARKGLVEKVHGGAVPVGAPSSHEPGFEAKSGWEPSAKDAISRAAAALVRPESAIALAAGTTTYALARQLVGVPGLTVVTNSVRIASVFEQATPSAGGAGVTTVLTGGVRTPSDALVGPIADLGIRSLHVDLLFIGCHGIGVSAGLTTPNLIEAETNRTFIRSARRVAVVADHTKWNTVGLISFAALDEVDVLVTDAVPPADADAVADRVGELVITG